MLVTSRIGCDPIGSAGVQHPEGEEPGADDDEHNAAPDPPGGRHEALIWINIHLHMVVLSSMLEYPAGR